MKKVMLLILMALLLVSCNQKNETDYDKKIQTLNDQYENLDKRYNDLLKEVENRNDAFDLMFEEKLSKVLLSDYDKTMSVNYLKYISEFSYDMIQKNNDITRVRGNVVSFDIDNIEIDVTEFISSDDTERIKTLNLEGELPFFKGVYVYNGNEDNVIYKLAKDCKFYAYSGNENLEIVRFDIDSFMSLKVDGGLLELYIYNNEIIRITEPFISNPMITEFL